MNYRKLGKRISLARKARKMSQQQLADCIDFTVPHISHVENGLTKPSLEFVVKTANALSVSADELLCDSLVGNTGIFEGVIMGSLQDCSDTELQIISQMIDDMKVNLRENLKSSK